MSEQVPAREILKGLFEQFGNLKMNTKGNIRVREEIITGASADALLDNPEGRAGISVLSRLHHRWLSASKNEK